jgi:steroid delta-isomerase-like uncharacterized protein
MSPAAIEQAARRGFDAFNKGEMEAIDEACAPDVVNHDPADPEDVRGTAALKERVKGYRTAMSDLEVTIDELIVADDKVVTRWRARGTNDGELLGMPATGRKMEITGMTIDHFDADGRIAESWDQWDNAGFMQQLGISPEALAQAG